MKNLAKAGIAAALIALAGCGSSAAPTTHPSTAAPTKTHLTADDDVRVARANVALSTFCLHKLQGVDIPQSEFTARQNGIDTLTTMLQAHPDAIYLRGLTMRQTIADRVNALAACDPTTADALRTLLLAQS